MTANHQQGLTKLEEIAYSAPGTYIQGPPPLLADELPSNSSAVVDTPELERRKRLLIQFYERYDKEKLPLVDKFINELDWEVINQQLLKKHGRSCIPDHVVQDTNIPAVPAQTSHKYKQLKPLSTNQLQESLDAAAEPERRKISRPIATNVVQEPVVEQQAKEVIKEDGRLESGKAQNELSAREKAKALLT